MTKFLNLVALFPILGFMLTTVVTILVEQEIYTNHHWLLVSLLALQASAERFKDASLLSTNIFVFSILANILLILAASLDLIITSSTFLVFFGYLVMAFLIVTGDLAIKWYKQLIAKKSSK